MEHQVGGVLGRPDPGEGGGRVLADAVAEQGGGPYAPLLELAAEGVSEGEEGELLVDGVREPVLRRRVTGGGGTGDDGRQVDAVAVPHVFADRVERGPESGERGVGGGARGVPQGALARQDERDLAQPARLGGGIPGGLPIGDPAQQPGGPARVARHDGGPVPVRPAA